MRKKKYRISFAIGIGLSALFLWLALRGTNFADIGHALARAQPLYVLPLLAALAFFFWFKAVRIRLLLAPMRRLRAQSIFPAMMVGFAGNNLLPARLGDLVRVYLLGRRHKLSKTSILATMVIERLFDLLVALGLLALVVVATRVPEGLVKPGYFIGGMELGLLTMTVAITLWTSLFVTTFRWATSFLPTPLHARVVQHVELGAAGLDALKQPNLLFGVVTTSAAQSVLKAAAMYIGVLALGIDAPLSAAFVLLALSIAAQTLPSSPGFFGTIQLCYVLALRPYGVDAADAFAASIFYHLVEYVSVTITGLYFLKRMGSRPTELRHAAELTNEET
ncbi:MAG: lysylphosphatidylglycerol synthase transmembrane domain-containing protein [Acidiferrobacterales bacterium]